MVARIITKSKNVDTFKFITVTVNKENINPNVPTLIIGKETALTVYPKEKIHIRNRNIEGKVWWTYARTEKRDEYESDIKKFNKYVLEELTKSVKYISFNIITAPFSRIKDMLSFFRNNEDKYVYITDKQIYTFSKGVVFGISKDEMMYCGIDMDRVYKKLTAIPSVRIVKSNKYDWWEMKKMNSKSDLIIPYIDFLNNGDTFL